MQTTYSFKQKSSLFAVFFALNFLYYISSCYINTSNDGSHYALVSALAEKHSVVIDDYVNYTGKIDYAEKDGHYYSDRLPGTAFLAIPFYAFGSLLNAVGITSHTHHAPIQEITVIFLSNITGALGALFVFLLCMEFKPSFKQALLTAVLYAVCTLNFQEATHLFSHSLSMCLVLAAVYYLIKADSIYRKHFLLAVFLLAYSSIVELQNSLLFIPLVLYVFMAKKIERNVSVKNVKVIGLSLGIVLLNVLILIAYNYIAFSEIILKSNTFNPEFPEERSFSTSLSGNFIAGLDTLFTNFSAQHLWVDFKAGVRNDIPGLLVTSPILFLSLAGFVPFFKKHFPEALLFTGVIILNIIIAACHKTVLVRHIFTITPFLFFPVVFLFQNFSQKPFFVKWFFYLLASVAACYSAVRVFYITHTYWGREFDNIFPFLHELNIFVWFWSFVVLIFILWKYKKSITFSKI